MKRKRLNISLLTVAIAGGVLASCAPKGETIEALKTKKSELKKELLKLDSLIMAKDTSAKDIFYPLVVAKPIKFKDFTHEVEVLGVVSSDKNIVLSAEYNGKITSIRVKEGQKVSKGQTIAVIDGSALSDNENELRTQLEYAEYMLNKQQQLKENGVGSEFNVRQAQNQVNSLQDKIKSLKTMKGKTVVTAPFSGVVEQIMPNTGEFVGAGSPIARIVNVDNITVTAEVSEKMIGSLNEGKEGTVLSMTFDHLKEPVSSTIHTIGKFVDPVNRTVKIRTEIHDNKILLPNMTAKVAITDESIKEATVVSSTCILKDDENNDYIYVLGEKTDQGVYGVEKVYVEVLGSFEGESAVKASVPLKDKEAVDNGAKGITEKDLVRLKLISHE